MAMRQAEGRAARRRRGGDRPLTAGEKRLLCQFVACGAIFVTLVAAKLLLPAKMEALAQRLAPVFRRNIDVEAVFSAVGDALSKEGVAKSAEELYRAVFASGDARSAAEEEEESAAVSESPPAEEPTEEPVAETVETEAEADAPPPELAEAQPLPEGVSMERMALSFEYVTPVEGVVSSAFGYREHPTDGVERFHYGLDLAADTGTAVACFADGVVTATGESSSYGKYCTVRHEDGCTTLYAHCKCITAASGAHVAKGEKIAEVGQTGVATGPHLHFEVQKDGTYLNPLYYVGAA